MHIKLQTPNQAQRSHALRFSCLFFLLVLTGLGIYGSLFGLIKFLWWILFTAATIMLFLALAEYYLSRKRQNKKESFTALIFEETGARLIHKTPAKTLFFPYSQAELKIVALSHMLVLKNHGVVPAIAEFELSFKQGGHSISLRQWVKQPLPFLHQILAAGQKFAHLSFEARSLQDKQKHKKSSIDFATKSLENDFINTLQTKANDFLQYGIFLYMEDIKRCALQRKWLILSIPGTILSIWPFWFIWPWWKGLNLSSALALLPFVVWISVCIFNLSQLKRQASLSKRLNALKNMPH